MGSLKANLISAILIVVGLFALLIPYSLLLGWNIATLILFWFVLAPAIVLKAPSLLFKEQKLFLGMLIGIVLFYSIMVFMIYNHYLSAYFTFMVIGFLISLSIVSVIALQEYRQDKVY